MAEMLITIGIIGVATSVAMPMLRKYQVSNDLNNAQSEITQAISRARTLAQAEQNDSAWGFSATAGVLYEGTSYGARNALYDENYPIASTITVSGITDVSFAKFSGTPSQVGNITLTAFDGEYRNINIQVSDAGVAMNANDLLQICHSPLTAPQTEYISDADWTAYQALGDTLGACPATSSSGMSSATSSMSSAASSFSSAGMASSSLGSTASSAGGAGMSSVSSSSSSVSSASSAGNAAPTVTAGMILLDVNKQGALSVSGNGGITVQSPGMIMVNSSNPYAVSVSGNATITTGTLDVYGVPGTKVTGNGKISATVNSNILPASDPLASLAAPATFSPTIASATFSDSSSHTLQPGTYTSGINISGNATVTMSPGTYYIKSGGFKVSSNANVTGSGVFIYNTGGGSVSISGNGVVKLTPPSSGTYKGIVLFQDRSYSTAIALTGNGGLTIEGTLYAPKAAITVTGNAGSTTVGSLIIGLDLTVTGNGGATIK
jgi:type II secretory pathway pseudopilin PulG